MMNKTKAAAKALRSVLGDKGTVAIPVENLPPDANIETLKLAKTRLELAGEGLHVEFHDKNGKCTVCSVAQVKVRDIGVPIGPPKPLPSSKLVEALEALKSVGPDDKLPKPEPEDKVLRLLDSVRKVTATNEDYFDKEIENMAKVVNGGVSAEQWFRWKAGNILEAERLKAMWANIERAVEQNIAVGEGIDSVVALLIRLREGIVEQILGRPTGQSSSPLANYVEDIEMDVLRKVAGKGILDSSSLAGLIGEFG